MHGEKRFQGKTHKILHFSSSDYSACINHGLAEIQGSRLIHPFLNQFKAEQAEVLLNIIRIRYVEYNLMLRCQSTQKMFCAEDTQCIRQHMTGSHQSDAAWTFALDQFFPVCVYRILEPFFLSICRAGKNGRHFDTPNILRRQSI